MKRNHKKARIFALLIVIVLVFLPTVALAAGAEGPLQALNNLNETLVGIVKAGGFILAVWGIVQVASSFSAHDTTQRVNGFLIVAGGIVIFFAKEILAGIGIVG